MGKLDTCLPALKFPCGRTHGPSKSHLANWAMPPWGRNDMGKRWSFPTIFNAFFFFFLLQCSRLFFFFENLYSCKYSLVCGWLSKTVFLGPPGPWLIGWGHLTWPTVSVSWTKFCTPIIWCIDEQDSSHVLWCMVLDPTSPTNVLSSVDGINCCCWWGGIQWGMSYSALLVISLAQEWF